MLLLEEGGAARWRKTPRWEWQETVFAAAVDSERLSLHRCVYHRQPFPD